MISVVLADDHHLFRQGLRDLLGKEPDINVVGEASDGRDAIDTVRRTRPDVVVMDVEMPGMNGIEATARIRKSFPAIQVVMLSMHSDPVLIRQTLDNGAKGYVLKKSVSTDLVRAIRTVCGGITYLSQAIDLTEYEYDPLPRSSTPRLTSRELEVLQRIADGESNRMIADALRISVKTVEHHRTNLMAKLNTHNLPDLVRAAIKRGLIDLK